MDELLGVIRSKFGIPADQARGIVETVVNFIGDKLPAGMGDQLKGVLDGSTDLSSLAAGEGGGSMMDKAKDMLGGLTGGGGDK